MQNLVSVVIPTYNSAITLEICLQSIKSQSYQNIEIIVVDNNSIDETKEIAQKYTDKVINFWPERTFQKNKWIEEAKWKYIFFIDSDMELDKNVISECANIFENNNEVWWVCIPERSVWEWLFVKIRDFERSFYTWTSIDSARFFLLEDVKKVWWFEEDLIFFEESLLPQKIESKLKKSTKFYIKEYILHNEWNISLKKWLSKKFYYWKSLKKYKAKVKEIWIQNTAEWQIGIVGRYMIFLKNKKFYKKPLLAILVLFLKNLEFGAGALWLLFSNRK